MSPNIGRRERKRQQTLDHIADKAWSLFEAQGYEQVSMEAIAEAADVAKGTLYKYFPVKEALLRHRFHCDWAADIPNLLTQLAALPSASGRLQAFLDKSADWFMRYRHYLGHYLRLRVSEMGQPYDMDAPARSGIEEIFSSIIAEGQHQGELRKDIELLAASHYLEFLYLASLMRWVNGVVDNLQQEFHTMLQLFLQGMKP